MVAPRLAVIPARGGSKRIPHKNRVDFRGRPIIQWTIDAALESGLFEQVLVFTDDPVIADIATAAGAQAPFLRAAFVDDHSPVSLATCAAVERAEDFWNTTYGTVVQLMPNCPLRTAADIIASVARFDEEGRSFQISACRFGWMNPWWAARLGDDGRPDFLFPDARLERSQDLPPLFFPTGAVWVAERNALLSSQSFYGPDFTFEELPWTAGVDIDDEADLEFALAVGDVNDQRKTSIDGA